MPSKHAYIRTRNISLDVTSIDAVAAALAAAVVPSNKAHEMRVVVTSDDGTTTITEALFDEDLLDSWLATQNLDDNLHAENFIEPLMVMVPDPEGGQDIGKVVHQKRQSAAAADARRFLRHNPQFNGGILSYYQCATWDGVDDQTYVDDELLDTPAEGVEDGALRLKILDGALSVEGNKLKFTVQATPAWNAQGARSEDSVARALGKALFFTVNMSNLGANGFIVGWSTVNNLTWQGMKRLGFWPNGSTGRLMLQITGSGTNPGVVDPMLTDTDYELSILLGSFNSDGEPYYSGQDPLEYLFGAQFFRKVGETYTLDWGDHKGDFSPLYPVLTNHSAAGTVKPFNVPDRDYRTAMIPSHFSSFKGVVGTSLDVITPEVGNAFVLNGLWDIQAAGATTQGTVPAAPRWTAISEFYFSDGFLHVPVTPAVGEVGGIVLREANGDFLGIFIAEAANSFVVYEVVSDVWTPKDVKSITINAGVERVIKVRAEGNRIITMLDDTTSTIDVTSSLNINSTKHGLRANKAGTNFGRFIGYPLKSSAYYDLNDN